MIAAALASTLASAVESKSARADDLQLHATIGGAHAIINPQEREFGFGAQGDVALELPFNKWVGAEAILGGLVLAQGSAPLDPRLAQQSVGDAAYGGLGLRLHPMAGSHISGLWLDGWAGGVETGNLLRFGFGGRAGYDIRIGEGRFDLGPYVGYTQIYQPVDELRNDDAHIVSVGVTFGWGRAEPIAGRSDRDHDGVFDDEDACPDVQGIRTTDPATNGCPPTKVRGDRDRDTVYDDEDACPDVPGIRTQNPSTNGCPRKDTDHDGIFDDEDACPTVPGMRTNDPRTNGCPRPDRDNDGVYDDEDACPDVPGIRTQDPKTNGCPAADEHVHMEGDKILLDDVILFDTDSPRVRHVSWPIVERVAKFILANPDVLEINIQGHADAVGTEDHNLYLSRERAESVRRMLIQYAVQQERVTAQAFGATHLKIETAKAEQANRRVEFLRHAVPREGQRAHAAIQRRAERHERSCAEQRRHAVSASHRERDAREQKSRAPLRVAFAASFVAILVGVLFACDANNSLVGGSCAQNYAECNAGECVDLTSDPQNCGKCGVICAVGIGCGGGVCGGSADGSSDGATDGSFDANNDGASTDGSADGNPGDGSTDGNATDGNEGDACVPPFNTAAHCGACNVQCTGVNDVCTPSDGGFACGPFCTDPLFPTDCSGVCVDLQNDPNNCGTCGKICPSGICAAAVCQGGTPGDIVLIGHDFSGSLNSAAPARLISNAVLLPSANPVRVLSYEQFANPTAVSAAKAAINASSTSRVHPVKYTVSTTASDLAVTGLEAKYDVIVIYDQANMSLAEATTDGTNDSAALVQFAKAGGLIVVLDGANNQEPMPSFISSAGLVSLAGHTLLSTAPPPSRATVVAPGDDIATGTVSPYAVGVRSVSFQSNEANGGSVTYVVLAGSAPGPLGDPLVIHKTIP